MVNMQLTYCYAKPVFIFISDSFVDDSGGTFPYRCQTFNYCILNL